MKLQRIFALAAGAVVALAACDGDGTGPDDFGSFEAQVSGDLNRSLSGSAVSGASPGFTHDLLSLQDNSGTAEVVFVNIDQNFTEGVFDIVDTSFGDPGSGIAAGIFVGSRVFIATDGIIDFDDVSSSGLDGSFEFEAVEVDPQTLAILGDVVFVEGAFNSDFDGNLNRGPAAQVTPLGKGALR